LLIPKTQTTAAVAIVPAAVIVQVVAIVGAVVVDTNSLPKAAPVHRSNGLHILADLWGVEASLLCDCVRIEAILMQAALAAKTTVLQKHLHSFGEQQGVTGVIMLAESHISIHTWPEDNMAAIDIFICGNGQAEAALLVLEHAFQAQRQGIHRIARGAATTNVAQDHLFVSTAA
jgi:S-adenosylmethionine decarboxylase